MIEVSSFLGWVLCSVGMEDHFCLLNWNNIPLDRCQAAKSGSMRFHILDPSFFR